MLTGWLAVVGTLPAAFLPIAIQTNSYNADLIVEQSATPQLTMATTATLDAGTNNHGATWFETGFDTNNPGNGLPAAGSTFTAVDEASHRFQMAPSYASANGLLIDTAVTNGTFKLATPANYAWLSFLSSGSEGGCVVNVQVKHADGTVESGAITNFDWFGYPANVAWIAGGRITQTFNLNPEVNGISGDGRGNPRLYFADLALTNATSPVTSIDLNFASGLSSAHGAILAVSGTPTAGGAFTPIAVSGYDYDFVVEANAPHDGRLVSQTVMGGTNLWATTQTMSNPDNTGATWYEQGYNWNNAASPLHNNPADNLTGTGLPHPGSYVTNNILDHVYQMPPNYAANNAIYLSRVVTNATVTLATPASYSALSFLAAANYGPITVQAVINHQRDGPETNLLTINDWFDGSVPCALIANGRVTVDQAWFQDVNSGFPRLLQSDLIVQNSSDPITSIHLENTNAAAGELAIFALSGANGSIIGLPPYLPLVAAYVGSSCSFTGITAANAPLNYQWQKGTNDVFVNLADGGNLSGATTTSLHLSPILFSDQGDYRLAASDAAGTVYSGTGTLTVFSTNMDVTEPGDTITAFGGTLFGDGQVANAIDDDLSTKFGLTLSNSAPFPSGLVIIPRVGPTRVEALRIYTAGDAIGRDPTDFTLEGLPNGGSTYALIASNSLVLPDGRNAGLPAGTAPNPLLQFVQEIRFPNANYYLSYRLTFFDYKGGAGSTQMQLGEVELLGDVYVVPPPNYSADARVFEGNPASLVDPFLYPPPSATSVNWSRGTNGIFLPLSDGANIFGSQTTNLRINPATFTDAADYILIATTAPYGAMTSSVVHLYVYSTNTDVSRPGDAIMGFGDATAFRYSPNNNPTNAIDDRLTEWITGGSGPLASAGFPPFAGPVGIFLAPTAGNTILNGLRIYPGQDSASSDPNGFVLDGSNDGGSNFTAIASGPLSLPQARNQPDAMADPTQAWAQEILFSNVMAYSSYRLTFPSVRDTNSAALLEVGEVEFLGVLSPPRFIGIKANGANLDFVGADGVPGKTFSIWTSTNLSLAWNGWVTSATGTFDSQGRFAIPIPLNATNSVLFYRLKTP